ncbi:MAG TPA: hypothetical protein VFN43_10055 [Humibacillus sp.]|nr:hypothetical protein [Humibacillus sp.]
MTEQTGPPLDQEQPRPVVAMTLELAREDRTAGLVEHEEASGRG